MFDYRRIEALAAVIQEGGFEKAAARLHVTQSAVSQRIKQLEEELGRILLLRSAPPQPTEDGAKVMRLYLQVSRLEDDFHSGEQRGDVCSALPIGINEDSLATWFLAAIRPFLQRTPVVLDLLTDDQEETHGMLRDGRVLGCISTRRQALQGCSARLLGHVEYALCCTPDYRRRWFAEGLTAETVRRAPMITFNRRDRLNLKILEKATGRMPQRFATYYIPSTEVFMQVITAGLAYGAVPEQQNKGPLRQGIIVDLAPDAREKVPLYWHHWNLDSALLHDFTAQLVGGFNDICGCGKGS